MSINFCTVNSSSINAFCANRRAIVIDNLINDKYRPFIGTSNRAVRKEFARLRPDLVQHVIDDFEPQQLHFEQPFITVTVDMLGSSGMQQLEVTRQNEFVAAYNLNIGAPGGNIKISASDLSILKPWNLEEPEISVNITEFEM